MKSVAIVAMGGSNQAWFKRCYRGDSTGYFEKVVMDNLCGALQGFQIAPEEENLLRSIAEKAGQRKLVQEMGPPFDEVWAINHMGKVIQDVDLIIAMDDLVRERERYGSMLTGDIPVLTSKYYEEFNCIEYPIREIINELNPPESSYLGTYLRNTVSFAVAYAIYKGFDRISLFGCDFYVEGGARSEEARANCEFWMGYAHAKGIKIEVAEGSTTLDMNKVQKLYGYADQPQIPFDENSDLAWNGKGWELVPIEATPESSETEDGGPEAGTMDEQTVQSCEAAE